MPKSPNGSRTKKKNIFLNKKERTKGILTAEMLIVVAIVVVILVTLLGLIAFSLKTVYLAKQTSQADNLAQGAIEAVRNFRDQTDWSVDGLGTLNVGVSYYPQKTTISPKQWSLIRGEQNIGIFTRKVIFEKVYRDSIDNIAQTGIEDPDTLKVTAVVSWRDQEIRIATYLTNWN